MGESLRFLAETMYVCAAQKTMVEFVVSETQTEAVDSGDNGENVRPLTSEFDLEDFHEQRIFNFGHAIRCSR